MKINIFHTLLVVFLFTSCSKPAPQLPANKGSNVDSTQINLQKLNETLALQEDSLIQILVNKQGVTYLKTQNGIWYHKEKETNLDSIIRNKTVSFIYQCYTLDGKIINSGKTQQYLGKKEMLKGLEEGLLLMRKGEKMRLIIPWYLAYGMNGKDNIEPYTSLVYEITVED